MPWTPSDTPDPSDVLDSAVDDTRSGSHADALAKFLWFHHNALRHDQAFGGVRLSFALSYWLELAGAYPPARPLLNGRTAGSTGHEQRPVDGPVLLPHADRATQGFSFESAVSLCSLL